MQRNSVFYILAFCAAICLVCSIIVSSTAVGLKEQQDANKLLEFFLHFRCLRVCHLGGIACSHHGKRRRQIVRR